MIRVLAIAAGVLAAYGAGVTVTSVGNEVSTGVGRTLQPFLLLSIAVLILSVTYAVSTVAGVLWRERRRRDEDS